MSEEKSAAPQPAQRYVPSAFSFTYSPVNARSVPCLRRTSYCAGESCSRHSWSVFSIWVLMTPILGRPDPRFRVVSGS